MFSEHVLSLLESRYHPFRMKAWNDRHNDGTTVSATPWLWGWGSRANHLSLGLRHFFNKSQGLD